tara:strand:- start:646 stop:783 length:138 start_codon:yes stop_codon:yes gene_type:complete
MKIKKQQHKTVKQVQTLSIKDATHIHRYNKPIKSWSYMVQLAKQI